MIKRFERVLNSARTNICKSSFKGFLKTDKQNLTYEIRVDDDKDISFYTLKYFVFKRSEA